MCFTIIVQSFLITIVQWKLQLNTTLSNSNFTIVSTQNIDVGGLRGIKSIFKVDESTLLYTLDQGGIFRLKMNSFVKQSFVIQTKIHSNDSHNHIQSQIHKDSSSVNDNHKNNETYEFEIKQCAVRLDTSR